MKYYVYLFILIQSCVPNIPIHKEIEYKTYLYKRSKALKEIQADNTEAKRALQLLNELRTNPEKILNVTSVYIEGYKKHNKLIWNETLAEVAEMKAKDMVERNYFNHKNPEGYGMNYMIHMAGYTLNKRDIRRKRNNYYESLGAGYESGDALIIGLIQDYGVPSLGHRKHLLGIGYFNSYTDIGIGFVKSTNSKNKYITYCCVIIAPKKL